MDRPGFGPYASTGLNSIRTPPPVWTRPYASTGLDSSVRLHRSEFDSYASTGLDTSVRLHRSGLVRTPPPV
uniref:Uncharacterized protein n=1 Tax=Globodera rostochiensis TaxID=31243 RepID=A0A914GVJ2_GLORO